MQKCSAAASPAGFSLVRASDLTPVPWKNGGGITRQIAIYPEGAALDAFTWRISAAVVEQAGPFSVFSGIDRFIVVTHGVSMTLLNAADQSRRRLQRGQVFAFAGEAALSAELPDGPIKDFNLMVRRGQGFGELTVRQSAQRLDLREGSTVLHCVSGSFTITPSGPGEREYQLQAGDSLQSMQPAGCWISVEVVPGTAGSTLIDARIRQV